MRAVWPQSPSPAHRGQSAPVSRPAPEGILRPPWSTQPSETLSNWALLSLDGSTQNSPQPAQKGMVFMVEMQESSPCFLLECLQELRHNLTNIWV